MVIIRTLLVAIACTAAGLNLVHILQENKYKVGSIWEHLQLSSGRIWSKIPVTVIFAIMYWVLPSVLQLASQVPEVRNNISGWVTLALFLIVAFVTVYLDRDRDTENDFVLTWRTGRLILVDLILNILLALGLQVIELPVYLLYVATCYLVPVAAWIMAPVENFLNQRSYKMAKRKIEAHKGLITIGIVGSYGKTEVKMILKTLLSKKYKVLATPPSFSAAPGIARTINEQLKPEHQVFIAEMGASQRGEIREMTQMVRPRYGILTCISTEKRGGFHTAEAAAQSMNELMARIPKNGMAVFGSDGSYSDRMYALYKKENKRCAGALSNRKCFMQAQNIDTGLRGTRFELVCENGEHAWVQTKLLGMYSIRNIAIASTLCLELGLTMEQIAEGIKALKPAKHHLQLIPGKITVIDDSENDNPEAAVCALETLAQFPGRRILVTQGWEAGLNENYKYGTHISGCADYIVLIGASNTRGIVNALQDSNFPTNSVRTVKTEQEAISLIRRIASEGDTILYEGIYPDEDAENE